MSVSRRAGSSARRGWRRCRAGTLALVLSLAAAAVPAATADNTAIRFEPCELRGSGGHGRVPAECARFSVAENPDAPDGPRIDLFVARVRALAAEPAPDAFTIINGGPGASSVSLYVDLQAAFAGIAQHRDIVIVDQRGTGRSAPLVCPDLEPTTTAEFDPDTVRRATLECLEKLAEQGRDPRFYTTSVAVGDLEAVRSALGYAAWNLYGVSYGTRVAQHYLRRFPDAVRTAVLDGVVPAGLALGPDVALNAQRTLDRIMARCAEEQPCRQAFPDVTGQFQALSSTLRARPLDLRIAHPVTGRPQPFTLHYGHLALTVRLLSYAPETAALIPLIIAEAADNENYLPIASQALRLERDLGAAISFGMHNSVVCTEDAPFYGDLTDTWPALQASYLGDDQVRSLEIICSLWPRGRMDPDFVSAVASNRPVLLLSGEYDPVTPPAYADRAAALLENSRHLVAPGQGHGVIARGCLPMIVSDFVGAASLDGLDDGCVSRLTGDPFFIDLLGPAP
jgi:pimeloyl-ACP methyl ester carboxylesterase